MNHTINIGINYLEHISPEILQFLTNTDTINTLKYPGTRCDMESLQLFLDMFQKLRDQGINVKADIHGIPGVNGKILEENITAQVSDWSKVLPLFTQTGSRVFSTHIHARSDIPRDNAIKNANNNIHELRKHLPAGTQIYLENLFADFGQYARQMIADPNFIKEIVECADGMILDVSHVSVAAYDLGMSFEDYIKHFDSSKVKMIHLSHSTVPYYGKVWADDDWVDLHTPCDINDYEMLIKALQHFPNVETVCSEIAYGEDKDNTAAKTRRALTEKEYVTDALALNAAVRYRNIELVKRVLQTKRPLTERDLRFPYLELDEGKDDR